MLSCTTEKYDRLYSRWLTDSISLLGWGLERPSQESVLDLCGGTGAVSKAALAAGVRRVWLLDLNPRCDDPRVTQVQGRAEDLPQLIERPFAVIVCRQALGYLDLQKLEEVVWQRLRLGGRFVFNNFLEPRSKWKLYKHQGQRFFEASVVWGDHVVHLQASPRIGADLTHFRWHRHEDVLATFLDRFQVEFKKRGQSVRYRCTRRRRS